MMPYEIIAVLAKVFLPLPQHGIALELGYHDYQHMVRDFKEFIRLTPR